MDLKTQNVAQGIVTFANALIGQHYANKQEVFTIVIKEMNKELSISLLLIQTEINNLGRRLAALETCALLGLTITYFQS